MKFMKLGTRPDTFYTEEATRTVISEIPSDLIIRINNITYHLHKYPLLPKCGLLQRLCSDADESETVTIELHDIPGGENGFELCAKFCYGITINLSAQNFVPAFCAAKFLRMTESIEKGNFAVKLESFFHSCILGGWKDSIVALQTTVKLPEWSENLGIVRKCIDSIVEKILMPTSKVTWSYTYTRPGYNKKQHHNVPRDWWTEDVSELDIDLFRCIIMAVRSTYMLPPQLIGESLHVYASHWLPDPTKARAMPPEPSSVSRTEDSTQKNRRNILETIVSMIPADRGSVSFGFLLRLLSIGNRLGVSTVTKTELIRRSSLQFEEATLNDLLLIPSWSDSGVTSYDVDSVMAVLESWLTLWRRQSPMTVEKNQALQSIRKVGKLIDSYLQVVARDAHMPVLKLVHLAEALPDISRADHDDLYRAINIYLKEHPDLSKADKKRLCRMLDCQKLSSETRAHAVKNERLPLRTVVQVLFFEQEKGPSSKATSQIGMTPDELMMHRSKQLTPNIINNGMMSKLKLGPTDDEKKLNRAESRRRINTTSSEKDHDQRMKKRVDGSSLPGIESEGKEIEVEEEEEEEEVVIREEGVSGSRLDAKKIVMRRKSRTEHGHDKGGRDR